jgi:hypothetical protein
MAEQLGAALGTASATISGLGCGAGAPERGAKRGEEDAWCTDAGVAIGGRRGSQLDVARPVLAAVAGGRAVTGPASAKRLTYATNDNNKPQKENQIITRQARKRTDRCLASKIDDTLVSHTIDPISRPNS